MQLYKLGPTRFPDKGGTTNLMQN